MIIPFLSEKLVLKLPINKLGKFRRRSLNLYKNSFLVTEFQFLYFQSSNFTIDPQLVPLRHSVKEIWTFNNTVTIFFYPKSSPLAHITFIICITVFFFFPLFFHFSLYISLPIFFHLSLTILYCATTHFSLIFFDLCNLLQVVQLKRQASMHTTPCLFFFFDNYP
jgi:hypothetical protein